MKITDETGDVPVPVSTCKEPPLVESIPDDLLFDWRLPLLLATRYTLPVVELRDRTLTLWWCSDVIVADVSECHFRVGRPWKMKHNARRATPLVPFGKQDLILIDFPPLYRGFFTGKVRAYNTAPVGLTQTSLKAWKRALLLLLSETDSESESAFVQFLRS